MDINFSACGVSIRKDVFLKMLLSIDINNISEINEEEILKFLDDSFWIEKIKIDFNIPNEILNLYKTLDFTYRDIYCDLSPIYMIGSEKYKSLEMCLKSAINYDNKNLTDYFIQKGASCHDMLICVSEKGYTNIVSDLSEIDLFPEEIWIQACEKALYSGYSDIADICLNKIDNKNYYRILNSTYDEKIANKILINTKLDVDKCICNFLVKKNYSFATYLISTFDIKNINTIGLCAGKSLNKKIIKLVQEKGSSIDSIVEGISLSGDLEMLKEYVDEISSTQVEYLQKIYKLIIESGYLYKDIILFFLPKCNNVPAILHKTLYDPELFLYVYEKSSDEDKILACLELIKTNKFSAYSSKIKLPIISQSSKMLYAIISQNPKNISDNFTKIIDKSLSKNILCESTFSLELFQKVLQLSKWPNNYYHGIAMFAIKHDRFYILEILLKIEIDTSELGILCAKFNSVKCLSLLLLRKQMKNIEQAFIISLENCNYGSIALLYKYLNTTDIVRLISGLMQNKNSFNILCLVLSMNLIDPKLLTFVKMSAETKTLLFRYIKYGDFLKCYNLLL